MLWPPWNILPPLDISKKYFIMRCMSPSAPLVTSFTHPQIIFYKGFHLGGEEKAEMGFQRNLKTSLDLQQGGGMQKFIKNS